LHLILRNVFALLDLVGVYHKMFAEEFARQSAMQTKTQYQKTLQNVLVQTLIHGIQLV
jgi:hypothetical protein